MIQGQRLYLPEYALIRKKIVDNLWISKISN